MGNSEAEVKKVKQLNYIFPDMNPKYVTPCFCDVELWTELLHDAIESDYNSNSNNLPKALLYRSSIIAKSVLSGSFSIVTNGILAPLI